MLHGMATRARTNAAEGSRVEVQDLYEIDHKATTAVYAKLEENEANLLRIVQQAAAWSKVAIARTGHIQDIACDLCGAPRHTIQHVIWTCPAHNATRHAANPMLAAMPLEAIPQPVQIGVAPALGIFPCKPFWGNTEADVQHDLPENISVYLGISDTITTKREDGTEKHNKLSAAALDTVNTLAEEWGDARVSPSTLAITARKALGHLRKGTLRLQWNGDAEERSRSTSP